MYSDNIELFTDLVRLDELVEEDSQGKKFIQGSKLRVIHQHIQPGARGIHFSPWPCVVSIEEKISGPSSETAFEIYPLCDDDQLQKVEEFFEDLLTEIKVTYNTLKDEIDAFEKLVFNLNLVLKITMDQESKRLINHHALYLNKSEIEEIRNQLEQPFQEFVTGRQRIVEKSKDFREFLQALDLLAHDLKDNHMKEKLWNDIRNLIDKEILSAGGISKTADLNLFKDSDVYGELSAMEKNILEATLNLPKIHMIDDMFLTSLKNLTEAMQKRMETMKDVSRSTNMNNKKKRGTLISFDNVSCFSCKYWPPVASEWRLRNRKWPSSENVEMIVDTGCYVVPKQSVADDNQHKLEWRWSFSHAEMKIAALRSPKMHYCYFVFKSLFYTHLKPKDNKRQSLPSYIAKTCMFHLSEQKEESWWNNEQASKCVYHLMVALQKGLETKTLLHYFIKELNLLADVDDEVLKSSLEIVNMLLNNPVKYFTFDSRPVGTISDIKEEIIQLNSSTNVLSYSSGKKSFEKRVAMCFEERVVLTAGNMRAKYLGQIYMLLEKKNMLEKVIKMQEMFLPSTSTSAVGYVNNFLENVNKPELQQVNQDLQRARNNVTKVLGGIRDLRKAWCIKCDGICQQLIPCGDKRFKCKDSTCDYDICMECYSGGNTVETVGEHKHVLESTTQCSPYCYSEVTEERLGSTNMSAANMSVMQNLIEIGSKLQALATAFGTADKSVVFGNHGKIMSRKLTKLYECLGLKPTNTTGKSGYGLFNCNCN